MDSMDTETLYECFLLYVCKKEILCRIFKINVPKKIQEGLENWRQSSSILTWEDRLMAGG